MKYTRDLAMRKYFQDGTVQSSLQSSQIDSIFWCQKLCGGFPAITNSEDFCPSYRVPKMAPNFGAKKYAGDYLANPIARIKVLVIGFPKWHQNMVPKNMRGIILPTLQRGKNCSLQGSHIGTKFFVIKYYGGNYPANPIARTKSTRYRVPTLNSSPFLFKEKTK